MIALIIGFGSAGKRHFNILKKEQKIKKIYILTKQKIKNINSVRNLKEVKKINPDYIIIANETYKHINFVKYFEKNFKNKIIIVEKPLFEKYYQLKIIKNKFIVNYNLRFHPVIKYIKNNFNLKDTFYLECESSSYLPIWRNKTNYINSYSASKKKGGGVLLDLSHEIDYVSYLFNDPKAIFNFSKKISNLNIKSDDFALLFGRLPNKALYNIKLTYFNKSPTRKLQICAKDFQIYGDLLNSKMKIYYKEKIKLINLDKFSQEKSTQEMHKSILLKKYDKLCNYSNALKINKFIDQKKLF